jgi:hypothetical protein
MMMKFTRRGVMGVTAAGVVTGMMPVGSYAGAQRRHPISADDWMRALLKSKDDKGIPDNPLHIGRFRDPFYYLLGPISWKPEQKDGPGLPTITVPIGFVTDLASIPQVFWSFLRPDGDYAFAAILHDYLYWTQTTDRATADHVLKICMQDFSVPATQVAAIYDGVRVGGESAWTGNAKLRNSGEKRVLKTLPTGPLDRWVDWKKDPRVFANA